MRQQLQGDHKIKGAAAQEAFNMHAPAGPGTGGAAAGPNGAAEASVGGGPDIVDLAKSDAKELTDTAAYQTQPERQQQQQQEQSQSKAAADADAALPDTSGLFHQVS